MNVALAITIILVTNLGIALYIYIRLQQSKAKGLKSSREETEEEALEREEWEDDMNNSEFGDY